MYECATHIVSCYIFIKKYIVTTESLVVFVECVCYQQC